MNDLRNRRSGEAPSSSSLAGVRVLVTDANQRAALASIRSLGASGCKVLTCDLARRTVGGVSRFADGYYQVPSPLAEPEDFATAVEGLVAKHRIDVLLPITEAALRATLPEPERFGSTVIPFPSSEIFERISHKPTVLAAAATIGILTPRQRVVEVGSTRSRAEMAGELRFPLVIKPAESVTGSGVKRISQRVSYAVDADDLAVKLQSFAAGSQVLLQERVVGPGTGVFVLRWNGEIKAGFAHLRLREKPPSGGVSTYARSIPIDSELWNGSVRLLERLGWQGVAMVEYKLDARTGMPFLMEINGRLWGSLQLAIDAGVDFPALLVAAALNHDRAPVTTYAVDRISRWFWGDVDQLLARLFKPANRLSGERGFTGRWRAMREFVSWGGRAERNDVFRWGDPLPFAVETVNWLLRR